MTRHDVRRPAGAACVALTISLLFLASCAGSSGSSSSGESACGGAGSISSGTLSGHAFTVVDGEVCAAADGAISGSGTVVFDEDMETLSGSTSLFHLFATVQVTQGGLAAALAYGSAGDSFAGALAAGFQHTSASTADFAMWWGNPGEGAGDYSGTFTGLSGMDGDIYLVTQFWNVSIARIEIEDPNLMDYTIGSTSCLDESERTGGAVSVGNGDLTGIFFESATIKDVTFSDTSCD